MNKNIPLISIGFIVAFFVLIGNPVYIINPIQQVVVTQFGDPVHVLTDPGLNFYYPGLQKLHYFDKRVLDYDSAATEILTKDKKNLLVDNYAKWKIVEPLKFLKTVGNQRGAQARLDDIIYSELRVEMGRHSLIDIVSKQRDQIMKDVTLRTNTKTKEYGISILDVRIKRADLPEQNTQSVYNRMRAERERIAKKYRSEGAEEATKIRAETDKERVIIISKAYKEEQKIRGEGDAIATKIYAEAFQTDPEFYSFTRTLNAYKKTLKKKSTVVLSPDSEFMRYFDKSQNSRKRL